MLDLFLKHGDVFITCMMETFVFSFGWNLNVGYLRFGISAVFVIMPAYVCWNSVQIC